jgi:hypothetical protein
LFSIPKDTSAVFHEESEYFIGFIIRVDKNVFSIFAKNENPFIVFDLYFCENTVKLEKLYHQNYQRKILYKP